MQLLRTPGLLWEETEYESDFAAGISSVCYLKSDKLFSSETLMYTCTVHKTLTLS